MYNVVCNVLVGIRFLHVIGFYCQIFEGYVSIIGTSSVGSAANLYSIEDSEAKDANPVTVYELKRDLKKSIEQCL